MELDAPMAHIIRGILMVGATGVVQVLAPLALSRMMDVLPSPPDKESKLSKDIDKASREDCTKAYADAGLLAVIPIAKDAVTGKGCKW